MVSMHDNASYVRSSIQAGALGYILKDMAGNDLVAAIRSIHQDTRYFSKKIAGIAQLFLSDAGKTDLISGVDSPPPT